jgi:phage repressor protein C with HTH and peptisase S24 domain
MEEWKLRLKTAREAKSFKKTAFAKLVGVSNATATDWEKASGDGGIKEITGPRLTKICEVLEITPRWLLSGIEPQVGHDFMPPDPRAYRPVTVAHMDGPGVTTIKKVRLRLSAGITGFQTDQENVDGNELLVSTQWVQRNKYDPERLVAIRVKGESMEPTLHEDDIVVINVADKKPVDGAVFAVNYEGEAVVKRFSRDAGDWWLTSDNPDQRKHHRKICRGDACIIVGRVVRKESDRI